MRTIQCFHFAPRGWSQWFVSCSPQWRCFCNNSASFITVYYMLNVSKIFFGFQQTCTYRWQISQLKLLIISIFHLNLMLMTKKYASLWKLCYDRLGVCLELISDCLDVTGWGMFVQIQHLSGLLHLCWYWCLNDVW